MSTCGKYGHDIQRSKVNRTVTTAAGVKRYRCCGVCSANFTSTEQTTRHIDEAAERSKAVLVAETTARTAAEYELAHVRELWKELLRCMHLPEAERLKSR